MPDRFVVKGAKKLFSLTRTKIRLAKEHETEETMPAPLPLIKFLTGREISTLKEAKEYRDSLQESTDLSSAESLSSSVLQLMDIIEGVKHKFEPKEALCNLSMEDFKEIESRSLPVNILLMTREVPKGINLYIGQDPPPGAKFLSSVPTSLAPFLDFAFHSGYFSRNEKLGNITSVLGHRTLILHSVHFSLGEFGVELKSENLNSDKEK